MAPPDRVTPSEARPDQPTVGPHSTWSPHLPRSLTEASSYLTRWPLPGGELSAHVSGDGHAESGIVVADHGVAGHPGIGGVTRGQEPE